MDMGSTSTTLPASTSDKVTTLLDWVTNPDLLKAYALSLLNDHGEQLPVLLFLLDGLAFLHSFGTEEPVLVLPTEGRRGSVGLGIQQQSWVDPEDADTEEHASRSSSLHPTGPGTRRSSVQGKVASVPRKSRRHSEQVEVWEEWISYVAEMYLHPRESIPTPDESTRWTSPLPISSEILPNLSELCSAPEYTPDAHTRLFASLTSSISYLTSYTSSNSSDTPLPSISTLISHLPPTFPVPMSTTLLSTISSTLTSSRVSHNNASSPPTSATSSSPRSNHPRATSTLKFRSITQTIMEHLCGCAESETSEGVQRLFHSIPYDRVGSSLLGTIDGEGEDLEDKFGTTPSPLRGAEDTVREASLSILRRDDKLRWIFGDNFQRRTSSASTSSANSTPRQSPPQPPNYSHYPLSGTPVPSTSVPSVEAGVSFVPRPSTHNPNTSVQHSTPPKARPLSMSSFESLSSAFSAGAASAMGAARGSGSGSGSSGRPHRRVYSTSSSVVPLLDRERSESSPPVTPSRAVPTTRTSFPSPPGTAPFAPYSLSPSTRRVPSPSYSFPPVKNDKAPHEAPSSPHPFGNFHAIVSSPTSPPSPPFANSSTPVIAAGPVASSSGDSPPLTTTNNLTQAERTKLVRKSKKLNKMFGVPLEERAAEEVLVRVRSELPPPLSGSGVALSPGGRRRYSFPPPVSPVGTPSPTSPCAPHSSQDEGSGSPMTRSISNPGPGGFGPASLRLRSSVASSTTSMDDSDYAYHHSRHSISKAPHRHREERRKKLDKVQRLLGERVPPGLVWSDHPTRSMAPISGGVGMARGNSRKLGGIFKGLGFGGSNAGSGRKREQSGETTGGSGSAGGVEVEIEIETVETSSPGIIQGEFTPGGPSAPARQDGAEGKDTTPVKQLVRTRKMEQVFGTVPPSSMYLTGKPTLATPTLQNYHHHHRAFSTNDVPPRSPGGRSVDSYRTSIASLKYIIEQDPAALDEIARVYTQDGGQASGTPRLGAPSPLDVKWDDPEAEEAERDAGPLEITDSDKELELRLRMKGLKTRGESFMSTTSGLESAFEPEEESVPPEDVNRRLMAGSGFDLVSEASEMKRSASSESHRRTVKKAQKLANFFGTTRGEVWTMLLDDLEAAILEEEDVDDDDRGEVLESISRLRKV
ncbi:hypothetical protein T439DRAFT_75530 [Meredithblackwellia eburnea MCA 4105]